MQELKQIWATEKDWLLAGLLQAQVQLPFFSSPALLPRDGTAHSPRIPCIINSEDNAHRPG